VRPLHKRWRYLGAFGDELMLCAARVQVGPFGQTFWAIWDRREERLYERTTMRFPGTRGEVWSEAGGALVDRSPDEGCIVRIESRHPQAGPVSATLRTAAASWAETTCSNGPGAEVWTRKRALVPVEGEIALGARKLHVHALGVEDESDGHHPRHTVWSWSAGVGETTDGRAVGWNLVEGVNDPPHGSERAIWVEGHQTEPDPVRFEELDAIAFGDGSRLEFAAECERRRRENKLIVRYSYRQPFGTFSGSLPGGITLARGMGVMEHHDAVW
jgi:hypothetical protein